MASVSDQLLAALDDLVTEKLKRFKLNLRNHYGVSADLEKAEAPDTVDLMIKRFGPEEAVKITVDTLRKMNQNHLAEELENKHKQAQPESKPINDTLTNIVPKTRNDFLKYSHQLTLDLNTAHKRLRLSENNRVITNTGTYLPYPDHPDRFDVCRQVLCRESVSGRCYWELEWSGFEVFGGVEISVSYKSISRKGRGDECVFGYNDQSWSLICSRSRYSFWHNKIWTDLPVKTIIIRTGVYDYISRVGVYVDHGAGTLSFYSVYRNTMSLIHTVQTTFTQPLYPGFNVYYQSSVKLC